MLPVTPPALSLFGAPLFEAQPEASASLGAAPTPTGFGDSSSSFAATLVSSLNASLTSAMTSVPASAAAPNSISNSFPIAPVLSPAALVPTARVSGPPMPFAALATEAVGDVQRLEAQGKAAVEGLLSGQGVDVHEAMIAEQKAGMAFELMLSVRNKALAAYQQVMGMQF